MSTVAAPLTPTEPGPQPAAGVAPSSGRFLGGYALTLLVPLTGLAVLLTGWTLASATGWPAAAAATAGWSMTLVLWLRRRGWSPVTTHLVSWACPVVLLTALAELGRLSADGLVLWEPISAVLAVGVVYAFRAGQT